MLKGRGLQPQRACDEAIHRSEKGFALIDLLFVCGIIGVLSAIAVPRLLTARNSASSASALATMRTLSTAQLAYALSCGNGYYAPDLPSLGKIPVGSSTGFVGGDLAAGVVVSKSGYMIQMSGTVFGGAPDTCNQLGPGNSAESFKAGADPFDPANPRFFGTNALGAIYEDTGPLFPTMPENAMPASGHPIH
jgi:type II secretory pathway pseudopilin PulG